MPGLDECSLFSLEIIIDKLKLNSIKCLFPTVAFRLLDFPTLLIKHVEDSLGKQIKAKIKRDTTYKIPNQFGELKNKNGYFEFSKGKSTLFKVSLNELLHHLNNTPLYMMIMDSFSDKPRLVANCLIPLDDTMNNLYLEIKKNGLSVPCVKNRKGTFKIYNLMGGEIGEIHLAYRISSLGFTLMAHLPEKTIHKVEMPIVKENLEKVNISIPTEGEQEEQLQLRDEKERFTQTDCEIPEIKEQSTQIEEFAPRMDAFVQTDIRQKKYRSKRVESIIENEADHESHLIVPNVLCPPPLFYNSDLEKKPKFDHNLPTGCIPAWCESETESIREEDRYSDIDSKDFDEILIRHKAKIKKDGNQKVTVVKSYPGEKVVVMDKSENESLKKFFNRFPMLNELVKELTSLSKIQGLKDEGKAEARFIAQPDKHESRQSFIDRLAAPKKAVSIHDVVETKSFRRPCKEIAEEKKKARVKPSGKENVQKKKPVGKPEYGMTHTQRLRLAKTNPQLLEALELEERKRLQQFQSTYQKTIPIEPKLGKERFKLFYDRKDIPTPRPRKSSTMSDISFRKPIPTPRQSIIQRSETGILTEEYRRKLERESSSSYMTATSDPYSHTETFLPTQEDSRDRNFANGQNEENYYTDEDAFLGEEEEEYDDENDSYSKQDKVEFGATRIIKPAISFEQYLEDQESVREYSPRRNVIRNSDDDDRTRLTDKTQKSLEPLKSSISPEVQDDKAERTLPPTRAVVGNTPTPSESRTPSPRLAKYQGGSVESSVEESSEYRRKSPRRPRISKLESVHTESVSSYCPSDDELSDLDDESLALNIKPISELRPSDQAKKKLGYTWGV